MKLKQKIAFLCLLILALQVLPVKQLGKMLFSNQIQEELPHMTDDVQKECKGKEIKKDYYCTADFAEIGLIPSCSTAYIHFVTQLPASHAGEIHTPPPNFI